MNEQRLRDKRFTRERKFNIKQLWEVHHEIIRQVALGRNNKEIASALGVTPQTVSNTRNAPLAQDRVAQLRERLDDEAMETARRIREFAPKCVELLEAVIDGRYEGASLALRTKLASQHLARAGFGEIHKVHSLNEHLTRGELDEIKERARNAANAAGIVVVEEAVFSVREN